MIPKVNKTIENIAKEVETTGKSARTKARATRREVNKIKELAHMKGVPLSKVDQFSRPHHHLAKVMSAQSVKQFESLGAAEYVESLLVPEAGPARIPDLSMYPTVPVHIRGVVTPPVTQQAVTTSNYSFLCLTPNLIQGISYCSTLSAAGAIVWQDPASVALYSSIQANFACYRVVSMALRVINSSNYNTKAGLCYTDIVGGTNVAGTATQEQSIYARPPLVSGITASQTVSFGSFSQEFAEEVPRVAWLPLKIGNMEFIPTNGSWFENASASGSYPSSATSGPSLVAMIDHQTTGAGATQNISIEYFINIEAVPYYDLMPLFDAQSKVGNPAAVTEAFLKNQGVFGETLNGTVQQAERVLGRIREFSSTLNQVGSVFQGAMSMGSGFQMGERDLVTIVQNKIKQLTKLPTLDEKGAGLLRMIDEIVSRLSVRPSDEKCAWTKKVNVFLRGPQELEAERLPRSNLLLGQQDSTSLSGDYVRIPDPSSSPAGPPAVKASGSKGPFGSLGL